MGVGYYQIFSGNTREFYNFFSRPLTDLQISFLDISLSLFFFNY